MADRQQRPSDWRLVSCPATVALPFYVLCLPWTVILFIVMLRYANQDRTITKSSTSTSPYKAKWYRRQGHKEDPWISLTDHQDAIDDGYGDFLYGEGSYVGSIAKKVLNSDKGANVYIRSKSGSPAQPIIALSLSVFQSLGSSHPSPDPCPFKSMALRPTWGMDLLLCCPVGLVARCRRMQPGAVGSPGHTRQGSDGEGRRFRLGARQWRRRRR